MCRPWCRFRRLLLLVFRALALTISSRSYDLETLPPTLIEPVPAPETQPRHSEVTYGQSSAVSSCCTGRALQSRHCGCPTRSKRIDPCICISVCESFNRVFAGHVPRVGVADDDLHRGFSELRPPSAGASSTVRWRDLFPFDRGTTQDTNSPYEIQLSQALSRP